MVLKNVNTMKIGIVCYPTFGGSGVVATELTDTITDESLKGFIENAKKMEALQAEDIANAILYAVESPSHVNVNEVLIRPTTQER